MSRTRPQHTLGDWMAIAIGPALIMLLVGSLAFFLLEVFYGGEYAARLHWITACFVLASVLISRISVEEGAERASLFGIALGVAIALAMTKFVDRPLWAWTVLGVIWWCASKLVWNCTVIDDREDASGEGLLEAAGLDAALSVDGNLATEPKPARRTRRRKPAPGEVSAARSATSSPDAAATPPDVSAAARLRRAYRWWQGRERAAQAAPGLWVVYFSLAALPIFGLGQAFVAEGDRPYVFRLALIYVASALCLLLTTSFLGLRRYLRQRNLEMPLDMAGTWLTVGAALAAAILVVAMLVPRPNPEYAISSLSGTLGSPQREASRASPLRDSPGQGDSRATAPANDRTQINDQGEATPDNDAADDRAQSGRGRPGETESAATSGGREKGAEAGSPPTSGQSESQSQASQSGSPSGQSENNASRPGDSTSDEANDASSGQSGDREGQQSGGEGNAGQGDDGTGTPQNAPDSEAGSDAQRGASTMPQHPPDATPSRSFRTPSLLANFGLLSLVKLLLYAAALFLLIWFHREVLAFLARLWQEFRELWNGLFGRRRAVAADERAAQRPSQPLRPFAEFRDPFASGAASREPPARVVKYSFEALEAWAIERGCARQADETPLEFAERLAASRESLADEVRVLAVLYARVAYAHDPLADDSLDPVARLWGLLRSTDNAAVPEIGGTALSRG